METIERNRNEVEQQRRGTVSQVPLSSPRSDLPEMQLLARRAIELMVELRQLQNMDSRITVVESNSEAIIALPAEEALGAAQETLVGVRAFISRLSARVQEAREGGNDEENRGAAEPIVDGNQVPALQGEDGVNGVVEEQANIARRRKYKSLIMCALISLSIICVIVAILVLLQMTILESWNDNGNKGG